MQTKFSKFTAFALLFGALLVGCSDDDKTPALQPAEMKLISPASGSTLDMGTDEFKDGIELTWQGVEGVTSYILEISNKSDFSNVVLNISGNQLVYQWILSNIEAMCEELGIDYEETIVLYWRVSPTNPEAFSEVNSEAFSFTLKRRPHPGLYGEWLFDTEDFEAAATGNRLEKHWNQNSPDATEANQFQLVDGPVPGDKAVRMYLDGWFIMDHGIQPRKGEEYVSCYTFLYDVKFNLGAVHNDATYYIFSSNNLCFFGYGSHGQPKPENCVNKGPECYTQILATHVIGYVWDGDTEGRFASAKAFLDFDSGGSLGNATRFSSHKNDEGFDHFVPIVNTWYRFIVRWDMYQNPPIAEVWVDGVRRIWPTDTEIAKFVPDLCQMRANWLKDGVVIFGQNGRHNDEPADFARAAVWDYALSEAEIKALGKAGDPTNIGR